MIYLSNFDVLSPFLQRSHIFLACLFGLDESQIHVLGSSSERRNEKVWNIFMGMKYVSGQVIGEIVKI